MNCLRSYELNIASVSFVNIESVFLTASFKNHPGGTSLLVQYLSICLAMQGTWFNAWSGRSPHSLGQLSPQATTKDPACFN